MTPQTLERLSRYSYLVDACLAIDAAQNVVYFDAGASKLFGYTQDEAVGQSLTMLLPEAARQVHGAHVDKFRASVDSGRRMGSQSQALAGRHKSGAEVPVDVHIVNDEDTSIALITPHVDDGRREPSFAMRASLDFLRLQQEVSVLKTSVVALQALCGSGGASDGPSWTDANGGNTIYKFTIPTKVLDTLTLTFASRTNDAAWEAQTFTKQELEVGNDGWPDAWIEGGKWNVIQRAGWNLNNQGEAWANWQVWSRVNRNGTVCQVREQISGVDNAYGKVYGIEARYS